MPSLFETASKQMRFLGKMLFEKNEKPRRICLIKYIPNGVFMLQ